MNVLLDQRPMLGHDGRHDTHAFGLVAA